MPVSRPRSSLLRTSTLLPSLSSVSYCSETEEESLDSPCEQTPTHTFLVGTGVSGTLTKTICKSHLPFQRGRLFIRHKVSVQLRIYSSTPLWSHPKSCMCFTMIFLEPGLVFNRITGLHVFTGKSPRRPPCTTSSSNYQPPTALNIVPSRWRTGGNTPSCLLELPGMNAKSVI